MVAAAAAVALAFPSVAAAVAGCWWAYSVVRGRCLDRRGTYVAMQLVAEKRRPEGNQTLALRAAIPEMREVGALPDGWVPLPVGGDRPGSSNSSGFGERDGSLLYMVQDLLACQVDADRSSYALFGPRPASNLSLRELVKKQGRNKRPQVCEDVPERINWMSAMDEACDETAARGGGGGAPASAVLDGEYWFLFRDYVNFEERRGMLARRASLEWFWGRRRRYGKLTVLDSDAKDGSKTCVLTEELLRYGVYPLVIEWIGTLRPSDDTIRWESSTFRVGWKRWGKTHVNPAPAERLRKDPWIVYIPRDESGTAGDIVILRRVGSGRLVYAKPACFGRG